MPDFRGEPTGKVYTDTLNVWRQRFSETFPGITDRFEWFAIDHRGRMWVEKEGVYKVSVLSDDGSRLEIDGEVVVELDGRHAPLGASGSARLTRGVHTIRVSYFQGPRDVVALVVAVAQPESPWKILDLREFMPPEDTNLWKNGEISDISQGSHPLTREIVKGRRRRTR